MLNRWVERRAGSRIAVTRSRSVSAWLIATRNADGSLGATSHPVSPLLIISGDAADPGADHRRPGGQGLYHDDALWL